MTRATNRVHDRIAVIFDFDLTLAGATLDSLLRHCGADAEGWRRREVDPLKEQGWEEILAETYALVRLSASGPRKITRGLLEEVGRTLNPFPGVPEMFSAVRKTVDQATPGLKVEFYVVSSGLREVIAETSFAHEFQKIWATRLHYDESGEVDYPMLIVTHPEKVRYVLAMCKGIDPTGPNAPAHVYRNVPDEDWRVPLDQVVYVGDGVSDMAVFRLLNERGGLPIGVLKGKDASEWREQKGLDPERRVQNLAPADYQSDSELYRSLLLAAESIARKVALRRLSRGE